MGSLADKIWRVQNKQLIYKKKKEYEKRNPEKARLWRTKYWKSSSGKLLKTKRKRIDKINRRAKEKGNGRLSQGLSVKLFELQRGKCACCNRKLVEFHLDHIYPLASGGENKDLNIQLLCPPCNISKKAKHPIEFMQERGFLL